MTLKRALLAATILAVPLVAPRADSAQPVTGLYIGAGAGANWVKAPRSATCG